MALSDGNVDAGQERHGASQCPAISTFPRVASRSRQKSPHASSSQATTNAGVRLTKLVNSAHGHAFVVYYIPASPESEENVAGVPMSSSIGFFGAPRSASLKPSCRLTPPPNRTSCDYCPGVPVLLSCWIFWQDMSLLTIDRGAQIMGISSCYKLSGHVTLISLWSISHLRLRIELGQPGVSISAETVPATAPNRCQDERWP